MVVGSPPSSPRFAAPPPLPPPPRYVTAAGCDDHDVVVVGEEHDTRAWMLRRARLRHRAGRERDGQTAEGRRALSERDGERERDTTLRGSRDHDCAAWRGAAWRGGGGGEMRGSFSSRRVAGPGLAASPVPAVSGARTAVPNERLRYTSRRCATSTRLARCGDLATTCVALMMPQLWQLRRLRAPPRA